MADYLHGAYGSINVAGNKAATKSQCAFVYVGTAPVNLVKGGSKNVNKPIAVNSIAEAKAMFGYSDDFAKYTLCEAMKTHLVDNSVAPIILINVFNPLIHVADDGGRAEVTAVNGRATIVNAESVCVDNLSLTANSVSKQMGKDFDITYNEDDKTITIRELTTGALGNEHLVVTWTKVDPTKVTKADVIGTTDNMGKNTGMYAVKNVYQKTGYIPSFLLAPGFSSIPDVHNAMKAVAQKVNGHWDAYILADLPLVDEKSTSLTMANAAEWKNSNGYNEDFETVYFPMAECTDGTKAHLSVLAAANLQKLTIEQDGIPFKTASNTEVTSVKALYLGADDEGAVYEDEVINEYLCKNGIASAAYVGGKWVIWGAHSASYKFGDPAQINVSETNCMMMYYLSNSFQNRRSADVDKPMTANDLKTIVSEEQARLDALVKIGALAYGEVILDASRITDTDIMNGDYTFSFSITTTPLAKSLTAVVTWTAEGFKTYYEAMK